MVPLRINVFTEQQSHDNALATQCLVLIPNMDVLLCVHTAMQWHVCGESALLFEVSKLCNCSTMYVLLA